jgi:hypothetical protein
MAETFYDVEIALPRWATSCQLPDEVGHRPAAQKPACAYEAARSRPAEVRTGRSHFAFPTSRICDVLYKCKRAACANKEAQTRKRERSELLAQRGCRCLALLRSPSEAVESGYWDLADNRNEHAPRSLPSPGWRGGGVRAVGRTGGTLCGPCCGTRRARQNFEIVAAASVAWGVRVDLEIRTGIAFVPDPDETEVAHERVPI